LIDLQYFDLHLDLASCLKS